MQFEGNLIPVYQQAYVDGHLPIPFFFLNFLAPAYLVSQ